MLETDRVRHLDFSLRAGFGVCWGYYFGFVLGYFSWDGQGKTVVSNERNKTLY